MITISTFIVYIDMEVCVSRKHIMHPTHGISKTFGQEGSKIGNTFVMQGLTFGIGEIQVGFSGPEVVPQFVCLSWVRLQKTVQSTSVPVSLWAYKRIYVPSGWKHYARCRKTLRQIFVS